MREERPSITVIYCCREGGAAIYCRCEGITAIYAAVREHVAMRFDADSSHHDRSLENCEGEIEKEEGEAESLRGVWTNIGSRVLLF